MCLLYRNPKNNATSRFQNDFGAQNGAVISADEIADTLNTISYEVVTSITGRVPRVYINS